ncbi:type II secretion system protein [candidate division TA06 bacterium]|uniref:Type II secretion system protein n=1 Tax=candidate division TA06 bacterium TaxID=2250710 RepID=A0A933IA40_UNCT6|nr:type II secretion system protein [candidate division TA06 bacterium]
MHSHKTNQNRFSARAFSLIEMMIALVVFSIVVGAIISVMVNFSRSVQKQQTNILLGNECNAAFKRIENQLSSSFGWIGGTASSLTVIRQNGDSVIAVWDSADSMLYLDQARQFPAGVKVIECRFLYMPKKMEAMSMAPELWLEEVDLDDNGVIEGNELYNVVLVQIKIKLAKNTGWYEGSKNFRLPPVITEVKVIE